MTGTTTMTTTTLPQHRTTPHPTCNCCCCVLVLVSFLGLIFSIYFQLVMFHCELPFLKHGVVQDVCLLYPVLSFAGGIALLAGYLSQLGVAFEVGFLTLRPLSFKLSTSRCAWRTARGCTPTSSF